MIFEGIAEWWKPKETSENDENSQQIGPNEQPIYPVDEFQKEAEGWQRLSEGKVILPDSLRTLLERTEKILRGPTPLFLPANAISHPLETATNRSAEDRTTPAVIYENWDEWKDVAPWPKTFPFTDGTTITVGSGINSSVLLKGQHLALEHVQVLISKGGLYIKALNIGSGVEVDGQKIPVNQLTEINTLSNTGQKKRIGEVKIGQIKCAVIVNGQGKVEIRFKNLPQPSYEKKTDQLPVTLELGTKVKESEKLDINNEINGTEFVISFGSSEAQITLRKNENKFVIVAFNKTLTNIELDLGQIYTVGRENPQTKNNFQFGIDKKEVKESHATLMVDQVGSLIINDVSGKVGPHGVWIQRIEPRTEKKPHISQPETESVLEVKPRTREELVNAIMRANRLADVFKVSFERRPDASGVNQRFYSVVPLSPKDNNVNLVEFSPSQIINNTVNGVLNEIGGEKQAYDEAIHTSLGKLRPPTLSNLCIALGNYLTRYRLAKSGQKEAELKRAQNGLNIFLLNENQLADNLFELLKREQIIQQEEGIVFFSSGDKYKLGADGKSEYASTNSTIQLVPGEFLISLNFGNDELIIQDSTGKQTKYMTDKGFGSLGTISYTLEHKTGYWRMLLNVT